jgi:hypothetical protein
LKSFVTSAQTGEGVWELFLWVARHLSPRNQSCVQPRGVLLMEKGKPGDQKGCC